MPGTNNFLQFNPPKANQESDATYTADATRSGGITFNQIMSSVLGNKLFYQVSTFIAAFAAMMAAKGYNMQDGVLATLQAVLANVLTLADPVAQVASYFINNNAGAFGPTTLYTTPAGGAQSQLYRLTWRMRVYRAASTSSTLGPLTVNYTEPGFGPPGTANSIVAAAVSRAGVVETTDSGNTLTTVLEGVPLLLACDPSSVISFSVGYATAGITTMGYGIDIRLEYLGTHS